MNAKRSASVEEILKLVGFSTEFLPHPVTLLTIEQASSHAGVAKSTVDYAVESANEFREFVVCCVIDSLASEPGAATWAAFRSGLHSGSPQEALARLLDARATELSIDPAFACFLGGYDCLGKSRVADAVSRVGGDIIRRFLPFVETIVGVNSDGRAADIGAEQAFFILHVVLTEAYRRLRGFPRPSPAVEAIITAQSAALILEELGGSVDQTSSDTWDMFFRTADTCGAPAEGQLAVAVRSGAQLLLEGAIPLSMRLTVADVTAATGMSVATFYRRFGSIAALERALLACVGNEITTCFRDEFFDGLIDGVQSGGLSVSDAFALFVERAAAKVIEHIEFGRPDRQTIPWMQSRFVADAFRSAYQQGFAVRGGFYEQFSSMLGVSLAGGLDGAAVSGVLNTYSIISELLIRNAPDREAASAAMQSRFPRINAQLFV